MKFTLYRYYGANGVLLYVGQTNELDARLKEHRASKFWFSEITHATFQHFDSRESVLAAEMNAIRSERPRYNVEHNSPARLPIERLPMTPAIDSGVNPTWDQGELHADPVSPAFWPGYREYLDRTLRSHWESNHLPGEEWDEGRHLRAIDRVINAGRGSRL